MVAVVECVTVSTRPGRGIGASAHNAQASRPVGDLGDDGDVRVERLFVDQCRDRCEVRALPAGQHPGSSIRQPAWCRCNSASPSRMPSPGYAQKRWATMLH